MQRIIYKLMILISIMILYGCGSNSTIDNSRMEKSILSEDNFVALAKYHFSKKSKELSKVGLNDGKKSRFRTFPGANGSDLEIENALKITTVTPFNRYIESMKIVSNNKTVVIKVKNRNFVTISLYESDKLLKSFSEPLSKFKKFEIDGMGDES